MKTQLVNTNFDNNYVVNLLEERGITAEEMPYFLHPTPQLLLSPTNLKNIDAAYHMFLEMIDMDETHHIVLVVDSDVDGFTSSAIFYQYLRQWNKKVKISYVLHQGKGHGLSDTIEEIMRIDEAHKIDYVIIPDAGSNDIEQQKQLVENNIKCLILDHHLIDKVWEEAPDTVVIVNNQDSPDYSNKELCGAGVTWQFCRHVDHQLDTTYSHDLIDLAALGIISDMMSMLSLENRYIVSEGCERITNYFFKVLCEKQAFSMGDKVNPTTVAFYITPLINALIRVGTEDEKERLFMAFINGHETVVSHKRGANGALEEVAIESARECTNAKARQNRILDKAIEGLEVKISKYDLLSHKILFIKLDDEDFPPELNGLCAMKLAAKYQRPTIVARLNNEGFDRGSSRGLNDSSLTSFKRLMDYSEMFEYTAGHDNACGISIPDKEVATFLVWADQFLDDNGIDLNENFYPVNFERIAASQDIVDIINDVAQHEDVWGQHNPEPLIHITDLNIEKKDVQIIGKNANTIKIEKFGVTYMKFRAKDMIKDLAQYDKIKLEIVGKMNLNNYYGRITPQIFIENYQAQDDTLGF